MKIKRLLPFFMIFALISCEELPPQDDPPLDEEEYTYQNGTYVATYDDYDYNHGKAILKFTLTDDEVKDVDFDYLNLNGDLLSMGADMPCFTVDPNTFLPNVENAIGNATIVPAFNEIDVIAQAEKETEDANVLANAIFAAAIEDNTDTVFIEQTYIVEYINGIYRAEFAEYSYGYKAFLQLDLNNDVISNVDFDYYNTDGNRKSEDQDYNERMYEITGITKPEWYVVEIESRIENAAIICYGNDSYRIDAVSGATGSSNNASILLEAIMIAAKEGITETIIVAQPEEK